MKAHCNNGHPSSVSCTENCRKEQPTIEPQHWQAPHTCEHPQLGMGVVDITMNMSAMGDRTRMQIELAYYNDDLDSANELFKGLTNGSKRLTIVDA